MLVLYRIKKLCNNDTFEYYIRGETKQRFWSEMQNA